MVEVGRVVDSAESKPLWRIRPYVEGDEEQLLALFGRTFGRNRSRDDWYWKFAENPVVANVPHVWVAELPGSERLVGHYAGLPLRIKMGERIVSAMLSVETMTDPDFRRQGMLTKFGETVYKAWENAGQSMVIGLPNQQWGSRKEALGWVPLFNLNWLRFPLRAELLVAREGRWPSPLASLLRLPLGLASRLWLARARRQGLRRSASQGISISPFTGENGTFDATWEHASPTWENAVVRDDKWVRWRYLEALPPYTVLVASRSGRPIGYLAYRIIQSGGKATGYIADLFVARGDRAASSKLAAAVLTAMYWRNVSLCLTLAVPGTALYETLRSMGFLPARAGASFGFEIVPLAPELFAATLGSADGWFLAGGDSDVI